MSSRPQSALGLDPWQVSEPCLIACVNFAIVTGELPLRDGPIWRLKRSETEREKEVNPDFVLIADEGALIRAVPSPIELAIRADCLEDRGDNNSKYYLVP